MGVGVGEELERGVGVGVGSESAIPSPKHTLLFTPHVEPAAQSAVITSLVSCVRGCCRAAYIAEGRKH